MVAVSISVASHTGVGYSLYMMNEAICKACSEPAAYKVTRKSGAWRGSDRWSLQYAFGDLNPETLQSVAAGTHCEKHAQELADKRNKAAR